MLFQLRRLYVPCTFMSTPFCIVFFGMVPSHSRSLPVRQSLSSMNLFRRYILSLKLKKHVVKYTKSSLYISVITKNHIVMI